MVSSFSEGGRGGRGEGGNNDYFAAYCSPFIDLSFLRAIKLQPERQIKIKIQSLVTKTGVGVIWQPLK